MYLTSNLKEHRLELYIRPFLSLHYLIALRMASSAGGRAYF